MKKTELVQLLTKIKLGYPNFLWNEAVEAFWYEYLQSVPVEKAIKNLNAHIISNSFEPKIADIIKHDPNQYVDYEQQKIETRERLDGLKLLEARNPITPERLAEIKRAVENGEYDEMFKDDPYLGNRGPIGD